VFDIEQTIRALGLERMIFHSEADFQHALAIKIAQLYPAAAIRLEIPLSIDQSRIHLDMRITIEQQVVAIELKYATSRLSLVHNEESYDLRDQSADDLTRYGYCKDIERIERLIDHRHCDIGYAIILTNYSPFWKQWSPPENRMVNDMDFRIHEGKLLHGKLSWGTNTNPKYVQKPLKLTGSYTMSWANYSFVSDIKNGLFRFAIVEILACRDQT
jgi:hypothetical protein